MSLTQIFFSDYLLKYFKAFEIISVKFIIIEKTHVKLNFKVLFV